MFDRMLNMPLKSRQEKYLSFIKPVYYKKLLLFWYLFLEVICRSNTVLSNCTTCNCFPFNKISKEQRFRLEIIHVQMSIFVKIISSKYHNNSLRQIFPTGVILSFFPFWNSKQYPVLDTSSPNLEPNLGGVFDMYWCKKKLCILYQLSLINDFRLGMGLFQKFIKSI